MQKVISVATGDRVTLRKPHPCGGFDWAVTRTGADIGLLCLSCGRRVLLDREEFERRVRLIIPAPSEEEGR
jgi:hypothetical protein